MRAVRVLAACAAITGCAVADASRLQLGVHGNETALRPLLTVSVVAGDWSLVVSGEDIGSPGSSNWTKAFDTPTRGTLTIDVVLARPGEPALATASMALDIRRDWVWGVDIILTDTDPTEGCFGCIGHVAVAVPDALTPEVADSLYVVWGGNAIRDPVVY